MAANGLAVCRCWRFGTRNFNFKTIFDMENNTSINHENGNDANRLLVAVVDKHVKQLSDMQLELIQQEAISIEDYNEISDLISNLKEYMINCRSYNGN